MTDPTNKIFMLLGQIQADMNAVKEDISEIKLITSDYKTNKNRIIGVCVGVSAAVGGGLSAVLNKLGLHLQKNAGQCTPRKVKRWRSPHEDHAHDCAFYSTIVRSKTTISRCNFISLL